MFYLLVFPFWDLVLEQAGIQCSSAFLDVITYEVNNIICAKDL